MEERAHLKVLFHFAPSDRQRVALLVDGKVSQQRRWTPLPKQDMRDERSQRFLANVHIERLDHMVRRYANAGNWSSPHPALERLGIANMARPPISLQLLKVDRSE